ncbi:MAG TPA: bifunctional [glutamate--ammonia ligase]-adenylyl-L-tyrosine phosphorylase/[glutamate--ammonia-ligase] adenylyltransferase [Rhodocyclaceae bacterium]|nr:bifunctional [glutamate--ammonia ligase]-adenylyl-L-tyrosine phosphorylase/[glutamate--ammonia-ligase] adenylyltransferase [Rhodocyclaceae bacterium]
MPSLTDILPLSRYLSRLFAARPGIQDEVASAWLEPLSAPELGQLLPPLTEETLKPALRRFKQRAYAQIAARDLAGLADLAEVTETMTLIAEIAVARALTILSSALKARFGRPLSEAGEEQQLIVIAMGKLGGRELNASSDIDLIFVYPEDGETDGSGGRAISNFDFFTRLGRSLINAISEVTGEGQVFRVDMRLRPNGDSGPLVCSFEMLENYLVAQGREWERYAWIKARPLGEPDARWRELEAIRLPFVFRKYLDFGAINAMRSLHAQIRREVARRDMAGNVKLGPGGIREIEFIAQVFQLIRGGRETQLQIRPTLEVLALLARRGTLAADVVRELTSAYGFLRRLEHRLQYLDDAQTHSMPEQPEDQALVAQAMGYSSYEALATELDDHRGNVSRHFEAVFADPNQANHALEGVWHANENQAASLASIGYRDPAAVAKRLAGMHQSGRYQQLAATVRERFDALVPQVVEVCAATQNPDETLARSLGIVEAIARRAAYLELLLEYPRALARVAELASASAWAADYLGQHPLLLDELLDPRLLEAVPDWAAFQGQLQAALDAAEPDTEEQMDMMRNAHHAQLLRLLAQDIAGQLQLERLSDHLSALADIMLDLALVCAWRKLPKRHLELPRFAIISYGKLGGKELGYASDLDLIFLFDDPSPEAAQIYARLAMRINTWISGRTPAGILFETDLRLRPNGDSGLLVSSLDAFRKYQLESAWVWEHQALTRARFSAGDRGIGSAFEQIRAEILKKPRELEDLRREVLMMRQKMVDAHATKATQADDGFDLKQDPGGLIDVEFIVQYLVLGHAGEHPELVANLGNIALLRIAGGLGLIPPALAASVGDAYREYRRTQHAQRLNSLPGRVARESVASRVAAVRELWRTVFGGESTPNNPL